MKQELIDKLKKEHDALTLIQINDLLNLHTAEELKTLQKTLDELIKENEIYLTKKGKYLYLKNCEYLKTGKISINRSGNGFLLLEGDDLYIDYKNLNNAVDGDEVLVEVIKYKGKDEGRVIKILNRNTKNLIGEYQIKDNKEILKLDNDKLKIFIELDSHTTSNCVEGSKIVVNLVKELSPNHYIGKVVDIIGHKDDPRIDIKTVAYKYGFFDDFSKEAVNQTSEIPNEVDPKDLKGRRDLTNETIFTIDGDDTKDIDDAISIDYQNDLYTLGVHIADVSHYVTKNSPLDKDAYQRGTSSYLAYSVIPMLPHKLSNGICSLNEGVIRLTISCVMQINSEGNVVKYDIFPSYIKSAKKMTYKKVNDVIMRNKYDEEYAPFVEKLELMNKLSAILRKNKERRGYIDFSIDEPKIICDETGKCIDVKVYDRENGEKLIEDFMIAANETVASHLYNMDLPAIYRVHGTPKPEKVENFIHLVSLCGYKLVGNFHSVNPTSMQKILNQLKGTKEFPIFSSLLLRCMQKAVYSAENIGHFGLGSKCYTHFTSPIRRYPDLTVHRLLHTFIFENKINTETINYYESILPELAENCSTREQAAVEAEREVDDMKMAEYMEDHIGEVYEGHISGVTNFGFFVEIDNMIEGLVHANTLEGDYYSYIEELMALVGQKTKKMYRLGSPVRVKVVGASKEARTIDFIVLESDQNGNQKPQSEI